MTQLETFPDAMMMGPHAINRGDNRRSRVVDVVVGSDERLLPDTLECGGHEDGTAKLRSLDRDETRRGRTR